MQVTSTLEVNASNININIFKSMQVTSTLEVNEVTSTLEVNASNHQRLKSMQVTINVGSQCK